MPLGVIQSPKDIVLFVQSETTCDVDCQVFLKAEARLRLQMQDGTISKHDDDVSGPWASVSDLAWPLSHHKAKLGIHAASTSSGDDSGGNCG